MVFQEYDYILKAQGARLRAQGTGLRAPSYAKASDGKAGLKGNLIGLLSRVER